MKSFDNLGVGIEAGLGSETTHLCCQHGAQARLGGRGDVLGKFGRRTVSPVHSWQYW